MATDIRISASRFASSKYLYVYQKFRIIKITYVYQKFRIIKITYCTVNGRFEAAPFAQTRGGRKAQTPVIKDNIDWGRNLGMDKMDIIWGYAGNKFLKNEV